jgi:zinc transport system substrate-binding protein
MRTLLLIIVMCLAACSEREPAGAGLKAGGEAPVVIATNYPLYFFAQQVAGDAVDVRFPDIEGDPASWSPDGDQAAALQSADLIMLNGAGYESWLSFVTLFEDRLVDTTAALTGQLLPVEQASVHQHGPEGEHSHPGTAYTTWLDPQMAIEQARVIEQVLSALAPEHEADFKTRLTQLEARLQDLDDTLKQAFAGLQGQPVLFSHPVYQYLQHRYRINGRSLHWEPGEAPGVRAWIDFQNLLREHPSRLLIWEDQPLSEVQTRLEETGVRSVVFQPAGNRPGQGDYFSVMEDNLRRFMDASTNIDDKD